MSDEISKVIEQFIIAFFDRSGDDNSSVGEAINCPNDLEKDTIEAVANVDAIILYVFMAVSTSVWLILNSLGAIIHKKISLPIRIKRRVGINQIHHAAFHAQHYWQVIADV